MEDTMLKKLDEAHCDLKLMLNNCRWNGISIDFAPPKMIRLWASYNGIKACLHKIYPISADNIEKPFLHPHPWPCAIKVLKGAYEMEMGHSTTLSPPLISIKFVVSADSSYEMLYKDIWHSVNPINDDPVYSIMLIGKKWDRKMLKKNTSSPRILNELEKECLINEFDQLL